MTAFRELLRDIPLLATHGDLSTPVTGIRGDSRTVRPGDLFVALRGERFDGHTYIDDAVERGAVAVVAEPLHHIRTRAPVAVTGDTKQAFGLLASAFNGYPSRRLRLIGVTGTDGKTSTTMLTAAVLRAAGVTTGHCTTVELHDGREAVPSRVGFTTPQPPELQEFLARCVTAGCDAVIMEVSSHALAMGRVAGCEFDVAVFTNLSPEHLDFHNTLEEYRLAKATLFDMLRERRHKQYPTAGVINADDPHSGFFTEHCGQPLLYGFDAGAHLRATDVRYGSSGTSFTLVPGAAGDGTHTGILPPGPVPIETPLLGRFNVYNLLAAAAAGLVSGATVDDVKRASASLQPPPGRMERIDAGQPFNVYVDFAHTPQALSAALDTIRDLHSGRVAAVFGHAGGRDRNHRRGLITATRDRAGFIILTMDDPYHEDPAAILDEMRRAAITEGLQEGPDFLCILDRREAFRAAFAWARPGDTVLLAGRGHETTIVAGSTTLDFHDPTVAVELLKGRTR